MKKMLAAASMLLLAGCASVPRPQVHVVPKAPKVQAGSPVVMTPLTRPHWYDRFRHSNGKFWH